MKLDLNKLKLKQEIDRNGVFVWGALFFGLLGISYQNRGSSTWLGLFLEAAFFVIYLLFLNRLQKNLSYSFWSFLIIFLIYLLAKIVGGAILSTSSLAFTFSFILLFSVAYSLWSPIFYPIVSWWEYDFRYRDDLKVKVKLNNKVFDGRLTDLRKEAGCIASFENLIIGEEVDIEPFEDLESVSFKAEIMSKRKYSLGRPYNYGVRFLLEEGSGHHLFKNFVKFWKNERKLKMKKKFKNESSDS